MICLFLRRDALCTESICAIAVPHVTRDRFSFRTNDPGTVAKKELPIVLAPCVVILHTEADKGGAILVPKRLGEFEDQRISGINGNIDLSAQYEILLCIVLIDIVDQRCAAKGVASIERRPEAIIKGIADVPFNSR